MKIYIVEDDVRAEEILQKMIVRVLEEMGTTAEIKYYTNGIVFLQEYAGDGDFVFLDCDMPMINGMEVAKRLREQDGRVVIIFVTNLVQYAVEGYEVGAFDYILSPCPILFSPGNSGVRCKNMKAGKMRSFPFGRGAASSK